MYPALHPAQKAPYPEAHISQIGDYISAGDDCRINKAWQADLPQLYLEGTWATWVYLHRSPGALARPSKLTALCIILKLHMRPSGKIKEEASLQRSAQVSSSHVIRLSPVVPSPSPRLSLPRSLPGSEFLTTLTYHGHGQKRIPT